MRPVFIYALNCPDTGKARYLGQTLCPDRRLYCHIRDARKGKKLYVSSWIKGLLSKNLLPILEILDVVPDTEADFWEIEYLQNFRERGFFLTNLAPGGKKGVVIPGRKHSLETKLKIGKSNRGKIRTPELRERLRAIHLGKKHIQHRKHSSGIR